MGGCAILTVRKGIFVPEVRISALERLEKAIVRYRDAKVLQ